MEPAESRSSLLISCSIAYSCVGILLGVAVFVCFLALPEFFNLHISLWGFASALFAFLTLVVHIQHVKGNRDVWVYRLKFFILIGFFTSVGCVVAFIVYITLAAVQKQPLIPVNNNDNDNENAKGYYLAAIWVFMTWKWSLALFLTARSYRRKYTTSMESNSFLNFIYNGNLTFCPPDAVPSRPLEEEL